MICVSIAPTNTEELFVQFLKAEVQAMIVEVRLDFLKKIDMNTLAQILHQKTAQVIFTLRSEIEGGNWKGSSDKMGELLQKLSSALTPNYWDVEAHIDPKFVKAIRRKSKVILSHHDFIKTPQDLDGILQKMKEIPADFYKIATMAHSTVDALRVLECMKDNEDVLGVAMGEKGHISRILALVFDAPWIYASLDEKKTAPGQLSADELYHVYHASWLTPSWEITGLIGDPVEQSIGQITHNKAYYEKDIEAVYVKMKITPDELDEGMRLFSELGFRGLSVTMPLKELVGKHCTSIDEKAKKIGAINTLTFDGETIIGSNTDADGALDAIEAIELVKGKKVAILGAGGAARAIAYEAKKRGAEVTVCARRIEQAEALAKDVGLEFRELSGRLPEYDMLVNTTPVEMPIDKGEVIPGTVVMDIKSSPEEIELLKVAEKKGCRCIHGIEMYHRQAEGQERCWFPAVSEFIPE